MKIKTFTKLLILSLCFHMGYQSDAQQSSTTNDFQISAKVINEEKELIELGNIFLRYPKDSSFIRGEVLVDGMLRIDAQAATSFLLHISALGYEDYYQVLQPLNQDLDLGTIQLQANYLQEVEVRAQQNFFEQQADKLVVNVERTSLSSLGSAMDVLRASPKLALNSSQQLSVIGKGNAMVYLNGQLIPSTQILESLSSDEIKSIEIIENPSAKYDAAGSAVINIITKKNSLQGYKIGLIQEFEQRKYFRAYSKANAYFRVSKFMFQTSYGIRPFIRAGREHYFRNYELDDIAVNIDNRLKYTRDILAHDYNFKSSYQINQNSLIGFQYSGTSAHGEKEGNNNNKYNQNEQLAFELNTKVTGPYDQQTHLANLFFNQSLDSLGSSLFASAQYSNYHLDRLENVRQALNQDADQVDIDRRTVNHSDIDVLSFQLDYLKVFSPQIKFEVGLKQAIITNQSKLNFELLQGDDLFKADPRLSNRYDYEEQISAFYTQFSWDKNSISSRLGLRGEWTKTNGEADSEQIDQAIQQNYFNIFPNLSLHKKINDQLSANLAYGYRIQRPTYQDLNPFIFYVDSLVSLQGNANLIPEYSHEISSSLNYKQFSFHLNYNYFKDKINTIIRIEDPENPGIFAFIRDNIKSYEQWSAFSKYNLQYKSYNAFFLLGGRLETHEVQDLDNLLVNRKFNFYAYTNQSLMLPAKLKLELIFRYSSPRVDGIYIDNPNSSFSLALSRRFWNNQMTIRVLANDIFDKDKFTGISNFGGSSFRYLSEGDQHYVKLSLQWDFGKLGIEQLQEKKISKSELYRISRQ